MGKHCIFFTHSFIRGHWDSSLVKDRGGLSQISPVRTWWGSWRWKPHACGVLLKRWPQESLTSNLTHTPAIHQSCHESSPSTWRLQQPLLKGRWSQPSWSGFTCLYRFRSGDLPSDLNSLIGLRKVIGVQFVNFLHFVRMGVATSMLFTYWSGYQKSLKYNLQYKNRKWKSCRKMWQYFIF